MTVDVETFIDALHRLEADGDAGPIAGLFAPDAEISNALGGVPPAEHGALAFWRSYRDAFDSIESRFRTVLADDECAMLEWRSKIVRHGEPGGYGGVSVIEFGDGGITAFRAYFDPAAIEVEEAAE